MTVLSTLKAPCLDAALIELLVLDFDGVLTDNTVWVSEDGKEMVRCWRSDGLGLSQLQALGVPVWVLSTEKNPVVSKRCEKLKLPCRQNLPDKAAALQSLTEELKVVLSQVAYVGNDINDLSSLSIVGYPIIVQDAHDSVKSVALYQTQRPGGFGAVREVCDGLIESRQAAGLAPVVQTSGASK
jgi:YrbI family 3-deoxy-D-manno-octulosonate 8-phosphate phosphatase